MQVSFRNEDGKGKTFQSKFPVQDSFRNEDGKGNFFQVSSLQVETSSQVPAGF